MRKGELQLMENVFAFFLIIILGMVALIFYATSQAGAQADERDANAQLEALKTARSLYNFPELKCPADGTGRCLDVYKAAAFNETIAEAEMRDAYYQLLGASRISLSCLDCGDPIVVYDAIPPQARSFRTYHLPTVAYNASDLTSRIGWIEVTVT